MVQHFGLYKSWLLLMGLLLCPLDFCDEVLVHLLQTCSRQKNSSCERYLLLYFVPEFRVCSFFCGRAWDGFEGKCTRISNGNLDLGPVLPGFVRCLPQDVRLYSEGDGLRSKYRLPIVSLGGLPTLLGWTILLLVLSHLEIRNHKAIVFGELKFEGRLFLSKLDLYGFYVLQTVLLLITSRRTHLSGR
jgi:hypothetical protein